jgi:protein disulfide-isomerase
MDKEKYLKYKNKYLELKKKNNQHGGSDSYFFNEKNINEKNPDMYLFKADWCGHCKNFKETWNVLSNKFKNKVNFIIYDSKINEKEVKEWRVNGYPSIIFRKGTQAIEYNNNRDIDTLINFIDDNIRSV